MRTRGFGGVIVAALAVASPVSAQDAPAPKPVDRVELRHQIYVMEGALARAVEFGAQRLNRELRSIAPDMFLLAGNAQARGVYLDGYGIFFDVEVPMLRESMMWSLRVMLDQDDSRIRSDVANLRRWVQRVEDPAARASLEQAIRRLESQAMPLAGVGRPGAGRPAGGDSPVAAASAVSAGAPTQGTPPPGATPQGTPPGATPPGTPPGTAPSAEPPDVSWLRDPNQTNRAYTESVQRALIDAMLDFSAPMAIGDAEWLTVAARDNARRDTLAPQDPFEEVVTLMLKIRGADLREYRSGTIDKPVARKRVQVSEF
jgi:hypothetical protein